MDGKGEEAKDTIEYVYRISTSQEWDELQSKGFTFGEILDKARGCIHLCKLDQVQLVLQNFFLGDGEGDLYLLQINPKELGVELVYKEDTIFPTFSTYSSTYVSNTFPRFYDHSGSFSSLPLRAVTKVEKLIYRDGHLSCNLLN